MITIEGKIDAYTLILKSYLCFDMIDIKSDDDVKQVNIDKTRRQMYWTDKDKNKFVPEVKCFISLY